MREFLRLTWHFLMLTWWLWGMGLGMLIAYMKGDFNDADCD